MTLGSMVSRIPGPRGGGGGRITGRGEYTKCSGAGADSMGDGVL